MQFAKQWVTGSNRSSAMPPRGGSGFTLIEVLVAVALFIMLIIVTSSLLSQAIDTSRKTRSQSAAVNNIHASVETIARTIREGTSYHCGSEGVRTTPDLAACKTAAGAQEISIKNRDGSLTSFRFNEGAIEVAQGGSVWIPLTAPDVDVEILTFRAISANIGENEQPKILISAKGAAGADPATRSDFDLQTTVSQRYMFSTLVEGARCGNGLCEWGESSSMCPADCGTGTDGRNSGDILLVVDTSSSIDSAELNIFKQSLRFAANQLFARDSGVKMGVIEFSTNAEVRQHLTTDLSSVLSAINALTNGGDTNTPVGLRAADYEFRNLRETSTSFTAGAVPKGNVNDTTSVSPAPNRLDSQHPNFVILFTDGATDSYVARTPVTINGFNVPVGGWVNNICERTSAGALRASGDSACQGGTGPSFESFLAEADQVKERAIVFVISIGISAAHIPKMEQAATRPDYHFQISSFNEAALNRIIDTIISDIATPIDCSLCPTGGHCPAVCVPLPGSALQDVDVFEF